MDEVSKFGGSGVEWRAGKKMMRKMEIVGE
jgi:hypothetical protein